MKLKILALIILFGLTSSCVTLKKNNSSDQKTICLENNLKILNGDYQLYAIDTSYRTLEFALLHTGQYNFENLPDSNVRINLKVIDSKHIQVTLYDGEDIIKKKVRKGKIQDDNFRLHTSYNIPLFWFVLNALGIQKTQIGILENGNLIVDTSDAGIALIVIIPVGGVRNEFYGLVFERKE